MKKMKITKELGYLLGAFKDGSIYKKKEEGIYRIRLYQKCKEWLLTIQKIFENTFKKKLYLRKDPRKELWYLEINNKKFILLSRKDTFRTRTKSNKKCSFKRTKSICARCL